MYQYLNSETNRAMSKLEKRIRQIVYLGYPKADPKTNEDTVILILHAIDALQVKKEI